MKRGDDFRITYGSGSVRGFESQDKVTLSEIVESGQMKFGEITHVSGIAFLVSPLEGILGLGYRSISENNLPTFIDSSNLLDKSFSFYLTNQ